MFRFGHRIWAPLVAVLVCGGGDLAAQACEGTLGGRRGIWVGYGTQMGAFSPTHSIQGSVAPGPRASGAIELGQGGYDTGTDAAASFEVRGGYVFLERRISACVHAAYRLSEYDFSDRFGFHNGLVKDNVNRLGIAVGGPVWVRGGLRVHVWASPELAWRSFRLQGRTVVIQQGLPVIVLTRIDYRVNLAGSAGAALDLGPISVNGGVMRRPGSGVDMLAFLGMAIRLRDF